MGRDLVGPGDRDGGDHEGKEIGNIGLHKLCVELEEEHHDEGALGDDLERVRARVELPGPDIGHHPRPPPPFPGAPSRPPSPAAAADDEAGAAATVAEEEEEGEGAGGGFLLLLSSKK